MPSGVSKKNRQNLTYVASGPRSQTGDDVLARERFGGKMIRGRSYVASPPTHYGRGKRRTVTISWFGREKKSGLEFVQWFFWDGAKEMMRNASCFVVSFLVNDSFQFPKRQVSQTFCLYNNVWGNFPDQPSHNWLSWGPTGWSPKLVSWNWALVPYQVDPGWFSSLHIFFG